jgi:hypothetical protein
MKMDLKYESCIDLNQPQHIAAPRNLINALMKSVGEHGEFRIELGGVLHYGTYMVAKPGEMVEVQVARLKKRLRKSPSTAKATDFEPMDKGEGSSEFAARADSTRYCKFVLWRFFLFDA